MVSAVVALLVGILCTLAVLVVLANVIPVPSPPCASSPGSGGGSSGSGPPVSSTPQSAPPPPVVAAPSPSGGNSTLNSGSSLNEGQSMTSPSGSAVFSYNYGVLTITKGGTQLWASNNTPVDNGVFMLKSDGTMGLFPSQYSVTPAWGAGTQNSGTGPYQLSLQDDGNLLLFDASPKVVWSAPIQAGGPPSNNGYTTKNFWLGSNGPIVATGTLATCQNACLVDTSCGGFTRSATAADTDATVPCYKFTTSVWNTPGAQQLTLNWKSYVKSS